MTSMETILSKVRSLPDAERAWLVRQLLIEIAEARAEGGRAVRPSRPVAWTPSDEGEDWITYYPDSLLHDMSTES
ncbi:MAG: hypothetical protein DCC65_03240 [Planctomycetota bacterium]|nr:MAG: hypothetical protein DCC65_03240 [Planctomycetota bacterium]